MWTIVASCNGRRLMWNSLVIVAMTVISEKELIG